MSITNIAKTLVAKNINLYYVGGCVRDEILGIPCDDIDIAVENCNFNTLVEYLTPFSSHITKEAVGGSLAVVKAVIDNQEYDFALCRGEKKIGNKHQDFEVIFNASILDDLLRRDLTINAIAKNVLTGELIDPYGGLRDLKNRIARPVSAAFAEDPLRVLRAARFISRFNLTPTQELIDMCKSLNSDNLPAERFGMELYKAMKQAVKPSMFFNFIYEVGWDNIFPELYDLKGIPQDPTHHPEGDAYSHTMHCIDAANDYFTRIVMMCHDLGKSVTTTIHPVTGKIQAIGHEDDSVPLADIMLSRVMLEAAPGFGGRKEIDKILVLVEMHMLHTSKSIKDKKLAHKADKLFKAGLTFNDLVKAMKADESGRPPIVPDFTFINDMNDRVSSMMAQGRFIPIVNSRLLMERGIQPGPKMGQLIKEAYKLQLSGGLNQDNWFKVLSI